MKNILFGLVLIVFGFFIGTSWKKSNPQERAEQKQTVNENVSTAAQVDNVNVHPFDAENLLEEEKRTINLFENAANSVVYISTVGYQRDFFSMNIYEVPQGSGSGFIWDENGHIVTNYHVIKDAEKWTVTLADQSTWEATLVGTAPDKDLAVLKIKAPRDKFKPLVVGTSHDLRVGQNVYAIGNPFGLDQTLTTGIISALGREIAGQDETPIRDVIQTDAAINPGNSGGPLLNSAGKLIGVNTAIRSTSGSSAGIGFSIPVDIVTWVVPDLIKFGKIQRPDLGATFLKDYYIQRYELGGVPIVDITRGGPSDKAGLLGMRRNRNGSVELGDIIVEINGEQVANNKELRLILEKHKIGETVEVKINRDEKLQVVKLTLAQPQ